MRRAVAVVVLAGTLAGCEERTARQSTYAAFKEAYDTGADCPELFRLRNRLDPKAEEKTRANEMLRSIECYHDEARRRR